MGEKIKSFGTFLNESSYVDLPSPEEVSKNPGFKEIQEVFPDATLMGGGKQPLEIIGVRTNYNIRFSRTGSIYYGGLPVNYFEEIGNQELEFAKNYLISKYLNLSLPSLEAIISGKTPLSNKIVLPYLGEKDARSLTASRVFKKGLLSRIKDFSSTIKYYSNHPLDKSYEFVPELEKIVKEGMEKSPRKADKEGDLTLEQKNYLKERIERHTDRFGKTDPELKGKPKYKLDKESGLVDVYGDFLGYRGGLNLSGGENFMGIKFGKIFGDFSASDGQLPQKNLSGFPHTIQGSLRLKGPIESLEGFPSYIKESIAIENTLVKDFSPLNSINLDYSELSLVGNRGIESLTQLKLPSKLGSLNLNSTSIKSLEGCPEQVDRLLAEDTLIEDLKGVTKKSERVYVSSPNLKDISQILEVKPLWGVTLEFSFQKIKKDSSYWKIRIGLPFGGTEREVEKVIEILDPNKYPETRGYSKEDKEMLLSIIGESIYDYFEKNPLEMYFLDDYPEIKKDFMGKRDIPDFSKLGKTMNKGFL